MKRLFLGGGLLWFLMCGAFAQTNQSPDSAETIQALRQEVQELKAQVAELRAGQAKLEQALSAQQNKTGVETAKPPEVSAAVPAAQTRPETTEETPESPALEVAQGIKLQGFGEVSYKANDARQQESSFFGFRHGADNSFGVGDLDLFLTSQLTDNSMVLGEIDFRETSDQIFNVNVERLLLKYNVGDYLKMSFGRFHTSTSYYNSVFHHGDWLQTAADRPLAVEFSSNGGLLPTQAVGVSIIEKIPSGKFGLNSVFEYGTSDTIRPNIVSPDAPPIDEGNGNGITAGFFARPLWMPGLDIGASFYHDRLSPSGGESGAEGGGGEVSSIHIDQSIVSAHVVYVTPRFEFLNEAFLIRHKVQETGDQFNTPAFYTLISQKVGRKFRPYVRYQYAHASPESPIFPDVGLRYGPTAGLRYDYNDYLAFKMQYDRTFRRLLPTVNDAIMQLAFRF